MEKPGSCALNLYTDNVFTPLLVRSCTYVLGDFKVQTANGAAGRLPQGHTGFFGGSVTLFNIAAHAGSYDIFPSLATSTRFGHHMIQSEFVTCITTVLTRMIITVQDIAASQRNFFIGGDHVVPQANDCGQWKIVIDQLPVVLNLLCFALN